MNESPLSLTPLIPKLRRLAPSLLFSLGLAAAACSGSSDSNARADGGSSGGGGGGGGQTQTGEGPCDSPDECAGDVCVALIDGNHPPVYCTESCGSCPDGFYCDEDTFVLAGLSFCRFGDTPTSPPPPPEEPPSLPCRSDSECQAGAVCATFMGERECTIACDSESDCAVDLGGVSIDFHQCAVDQDPAEDRTVCLPDPSCFPDTTSCIGFPF